MRKLLSIALLIYLVSLTGLGIWGAFGLNKHLIIALDKWGDASPQDTLQRLNTALDTINRPCGKGHPCGTLANADKAMVKVSDILVTSQLQERDIAKAAESNMAAVNGLAGHLNKTADALSGTAISLTGTADSAKALLDTANDPKNGVGPLLDATTKAVNGAGSTVGHIDAAILDITPQATRFMKSSADGMEQVSGIATDTHKMTTKLEQDVDTPKPWWSKIGGVSLDLSKIAVCWLTKTCV
jgi:hypothetical protein